MNRGVNLSKIWIRTFAIFFYVKHMKIFAVTWMIFELWNAQCFNSVDRAIRREIWKENLSISYKIAEGHQL